MTGVYGTQPYTLENLWAYLHEYGNKLKPFICDTGDWLRSAQAEGKSILFEAQLGALRDLDYGIYPYTPPTRWRPTHLSAPVCPLQSWMK